MARTTTIRLADDVDEKVRLYVYSRKMLEPNISIAQVINRALRAYPPLRMGKADDK